MMKLYDNDAYREEFMDLVYGLLMSDGTNDRANQIIDAFDSIPSIVAEPVQPNDPLTLEELRKMVGEPVYNDKSGWLILGYIEDDDFNSDIRFHMTDGTIFEESINWGQYPQFYRRKPEMEK